MAQRILVPVDGSDHAARAVGFASVTAKASGGQLYLIHVLSDRPLSDDEKRLAEAEYPSRPAADPAATGALGDLAFVAPELFAPASGGDGRAREAIGRHLLEQARAQAIQAGAAVVEVILEPGDPADAIAQAARRIGADQIVMGARGLSNVAGILLGSVSQKVIRQADCPVTVVK